MRCWVWDMVTVKGAGSGIQWYYASEKSVLQIRTLHSVQTLISP